MNQGNKKDASDPLSWRESEKRALPAQLMLLIVFVSVLIRCFNYDTAKFFTIGAVFFDRVPPRLIPDRPTVFHNEPGFDGQFYYFLAHDPFLSNGVEGALDDTFIRARRILFPLTAWVVALGKMEYISQSLILTNVIAICITLFLLGRISSAVGRRKSILLIGAFAISFSGFIPLYRNTSEGFAAAMLLFSISFYLRRKWFLCGLFAALGALTKETSLIWTIALGLEFLSSRQYKKISIMALAFIPLAIWCIVLLMRFPSQSGKWTSLQNFSLPFYGPFSAALTLLKEGPVKKAFFALPTMALLWMLGTRTMTRVWKKKDALSYTLLLSVFLMSLLSAMNWDYVMNFPRQLFLLPLLATIITVRGKEDLTYELVGLGLMGVIYLGIKILLSQP